MKNEGRLINLLMYKGSRYECMDVGWRYKVCDVRGCEQKGTSVYYTFDIRCEMVDGIRSVSYELVMKLVCRSCLHKIKENEQLSRIDYPNGGT